MSSINNDIPFVPENTTDPAAGLNLSINTIDALLQAAVISVTDTPPGSPAEGDRYGVDAGATGDWSGQDGAIARYLDGAWSFYSAHVVMSAATLVWYHWDGSAWQAVGGGGGGGGGGRVSTTVAQADHGFSTGAPVYFEGAMWLAAKADSADTLGTHIVLTIDSDSFEAVSHGEVTGVSESLTSGEWYFVSESVAGGLTSTEPTTGYSNPVGQAMGANKLFVMPFRAQEL